MNKVTYYIGVERDGNGRKLDPVRRASAMETLRHEAAQEFGDYTLSQWVSGAGKMGVEGALRLEIYTDVTEPQCMAFGQRMRALFGQAAVLVDYEEFKRTQLLT